MSDEIINLKVMIANLDLSTNSKEKLYNQISKISYLTQKKENIIKEVREYIEIIVKNTPSSTRKDYANMLLIDYKKLLEILDKGE